MKAIGSAISWVHPGKGQRWQPIIRYHTDKGRPLSGSYYGAKKVPDLITGGSMVAWECVADGKFVHIPTLYRSRKCALRVARREAKRRNKTQGEWRPGQP